MTYRKVFIALGRSHQIGWPRAIKNVALLAQYPESRVPIHLALRLAQGEGLDAVALAVHFGWPQWKADSVLAYARAYAQEIDQDIRHAEALEDPAALQALLPNLEVIGS